MFPKLGVHTCVGGLTHIGGSGVLTHHQDYALSLAAMVVKIAINAGSVMNRGRAGWPSSYEAPPKSSEGHSQ